LKNMNTTSRNFRHVGRVLIDVASLGTDDEPHFRAELAEESYAACGLRPFTGRGGFEHVYGEGETRREAILDVAKSLRHFGLTGTIQVRS
jgi:hypothetical protein